MEGAVELIGAKLTKKMGKSKGEQKSTLPKWPIWVAIILILALWILNFCLPLGSSWSVEGKGQFGDRFGAVNALFSGLAFAGIIYSLMLQREDLRNQQQELRLQRSEMELQRGEMEKQNNQLDRHRIEMERSRAIVEQQSFESILFNLIGQQRSIIPGVRGYVSKDDESIELIGQDYLKSILDDIGKVAYTLYKADWEKNVNIYRWNLTMPPGVNRDVYFKIINDWGAKEIHFVRAKTSPETAADIAFAMVLKNQHGELTRWWNLTRSLLHFIRNHYEAEANSSMFGPSDKLAARYRYKEYMDALASQMYPDELLLLFHYCRVEDKELLEFIRTMELGSSLRLNRWTLGRKEDWNWLHLGGGDELLSKIISSSQDKV